MPESTVRVGIVGTTWYAETHIRNVQSHKGAALTAIVGRNADRARVVADQYGIPQVFTDYESMIASGTIDAIVIIAPDELHLPITMAALEAGIHVLCEKPLASSAVDAEAMYRAATASGLVHMSFFALRTSMHHRYLRELIEAGRLGRIYNAHLSLAHGFFRGPDYQWRFDAARGTGALGDLGCYVIDLAHWYVGDIAAVTADLQNTIERPGAGQQPYTAANDSAVLAVKFDNGSHGTLSANVVAHQAERVQANSVILQGEGGTVELLHSFGGSHLRAAWAGDTNFRDVDIPASAWAGVDPASPNEVGQSHSVGDRAFIDAIAAGGQVKPDFSDGWQVQRVIEAAFESAKSMAWQEVPAREKDITGAKA